MSTLEAMSDKALVRWYEIARRHPRSVECERTRMELARRVQANGGAITDAERGICYVWDYIEGSLVRREFHREPVKRQPHVYKARIGTVMPSSGVAKKHRHGRRGGRFS